MRSEILTVLMEAFDVSSVAFGEQIVVIIHIFEWFLKFRSSVASTGYADGSGRPSTSRTGENAC